MKINHISKLFLVSIVLVMALSFVTNAAPPAGNWTLIWSDEFNGSSLDTSLWGYGEKPWGTTDNSPALITPEDTYLENGNLILRSRMGDFGDYDFTTGWAWSKTWMTYGYMEIRAQMPDGQGQWPAWWMLMDGWPPEFDVAEYRGAGYLTQAFYWGSWDSNNIPDTGGSFTGWHTYGFEWGEGYLKWYVDGELTFTHESSNVPTGDMYVILSAGLDSSANASTGFPNYFVVDYFRWYQGGSCDPTDITPYLQVNSGSWQQTNSVTVSSGDQVVFGPQPVSGGSWSWSGGGTSGTSREQTIYPTSSVEATATYTNDCGAESYETFYITVSGGSSGEFDPNASYRIINRNSGKVLTISGSDKNANAAPIQQYTDSGANYQRWRVVGNSDGYYSIISVASGQYFDIDGASTANGAINIQWPENGGNNQDWSIVDQGSGYYNIVNRNSGKLLDIEGASTADGAQNLQWSDNGGYNQEWQIVE